MIASKLILFFCFYLLLLLDNSLGQKALVTLDGNKKLFTDALEFGATFGGLLRLLGSQWKQLLIQLVHAKRNVGLGKYQLSRFNDSATTEEVGLAITDSYADKVAALVAIRTQDIIATQKYVDDLEILKNEIALTMIVEMDELEKQLKEKNVRRKIKEAKENGITDTDIKEILFAEFIESEGGLSLIDGRASIADRLLSSFLNGMQSIIYETYDKKLGIIQYGNGLNCVSSRNCGAGGGDNDRDNNDGGANDAADNPPEKGRASDGVEGGGDPPEGGGGPPDDRRPDDDPPDDGPPDDDEEEDDDPQEEVVVDRERAGANPEGAGASVDGGAEGGDNDGGANGASPPEGDKVQDSGAGDGNDPPEGDKVQESGAGDGNDPPEGDKVQDSGAGDGNDPPEGDKVQDSGAGDGTDPPEGAGANPEVADRSVSLERAGPFTSTERFEVDFIVADQINSLILNIRTDEMRVTDLQEQRAYGFDTSLRVPEDLDLYDSQRLVLYIHRVDHLRNLLRGTVNDLIVQNNANIAGLRSRLALIRENVEYFTNSYSENRSVRNLPKPKRLPQFKYLRNDSTRMKFLLADKLREQMNKIAARYNAISRALEEIQTTIMILIELDTVSIDFLRRKLLNSNQTPIPSPTPSPSTPSEGDVDGQEGDVDGQEGAVGGVPNTSRYTDAGRLEVDSFVAAQMIPSNSNMQSAEGAVGGVPNTSRYTDAERLEVDSIVAAHMLPINTNIQHADEVVQKLREKRANGYFVDPNQNPDDPSLDINLRMNLYRDRVVNLRDLLQNTVEVMIGRTREIIAGIHSLVAVVRSNEESYRNYDPRNSADHNIPQPNFLKIFKDLSNNSPRMRYLLADNYTTQLTAMLSRYEAVSLSLREMRDEIRRLFQANANMMNVLRIDLRDRSLTEDDGL